MSVSGLTSRILLFGKNGQVGSELASILPDIGEVIALARKEVDLVNLEGLRRTIREIHPDLIVNAAAYTAVDQAEKDEPTARTVNSEAPRVMAEEGVRIGATLIHYSTDYVFDGTKTTPYLESDAPNPLNIYGKAKLLGEELIRRSGVSYLIFRLSWVYATEGRNFLLTILRLATQREELRIVRDQFGAPTRNVDIAVATADILRQLMKRQEGAFRISNGNGTYHMTAAGITTWYDFARAILEEVLAAKNRPPWLTRALGGLPLRASRILPIPTGEYPTPARRPGYSVLSNSLLTKTFGVELPDWRMQLHGAFDEQSFPGRSFYEL